MAMSGLVEQQFPEWARLPNTRYFEVDSAHAAARYAIWVTVPPQYESDGEERYTLVFAPDGNGMAPGAAPRMQMLSADPIAPIEPFILVCIGYCGEDAGRTLAVRARDLLPPGEPLPQGVEDSMSKVVTMGLLDQEGADLYLSHLRAPAADKFLAFITEELFPMITAQWRVKAGDHGLFGYSYGGLFAAYAALRRPPLVTRIGAGSPGILAGTSRIFELYTQDRKEDVDHSGRRLHLTVCETELTVPGYYQAAVGAGVTELLMLTGSQPLKGLTVTSRIIPLESHATGGLASWADYLRTCLPGKPGQSPLAA
jgi:predicted alpha/beta superfamily hydrolase